jgi:hypothetical protein
VQITQAEVNALLALSAGDQTAMVAACVFGAAFHHDDTEGDNTDPAEWLYAGTRDNAVTECPYEVQTILDYAKTLAENASKTVTGFWIKSTVTKEEFSNRIGTIPTPADPVIVLSGTIALGGESDLTATGDTELEIALKLVGQAAAL